MLTCSVLFSNTRARKKGTRLKTITNDSAEGSNLPAGNAAEGYQTEGSNLQAGNTPEVTGESQVEKEIKRDKLTDGVLDDRLSEALEGQIYFCQDSLRWFILESEIWHHCKVNHLKI
jgi:hypothetical protein